MNNIENLWLRRDNPIDSFLLTPETDIITLDTDIDSFIILPSTKNKSDSINFLLFLVALGAMKKNSEIGKWEGDTEAVSFYVRGLERLEKEGIVTIKRK